MDATYWGIHANFGSAATQFIAKKRVSIGWPALGDLSNLGPDREAFKARMQAAYPRAKPGAIPVHAGEVYRFVHELATGDIVVYRPKGEATVHLGRVAGPYFLDSTTDAEYPNCRPVEWLRTVSITDVSPGALYELGSALSFFQIRNYADEWAVFVSGGKPPVPEATEQGEVEVSAATEQNTRDFIVKRLAKELKGHPFAQFVADLLRSMGYRTRVSPEGADGGVDIIAHRDELGFEPPIIKVQVKSSSGSIGGPTVAELLGNLSPSDHGLFMTLGTYAPQAKQKAGDRVRLIDGNELIDLVLAHYEDLDSRYKAVIPLTRMYIPQPPPEE